MVLREPPPIHCRSPTCAFRWQAYPSGSRTRTRTSPTQKFTCAFPRALVFPLLGQTRSAAAPVILSPRSCTSSAGAREALYLIVKVTLATGRGATVMVLLSVFCAIASSEQSGRLSCRVTFVDSVVCRRRVEVLESSAPL